MGWRDREWSEKLKAWTSALQAAALRPAHKIEVLKTHVIPRLYFHLILSEVSQNTLRKLDQIIRNATKELLHLPPHVTDGILYSRNGSGGLGMPKLEVQIPSAIVRKREALEKSTDRIIRASFQYREECNTDTIGGLRMLKVLKEVEDFLASKSDCNPDEEDPGNPVEAALPMVEDQDRPQDKPENRYAAWREWEFEKWKNLISQGAGIAYYQNDNISKTLSHISGGCPFVKTARIKRHNKILDRLRMYVSKYGWTTYIEPRLVAKDGTLWKPDLIFRKDQKIALVDVTVRYEDNNMSLEKAWNEKRLKYNHLGPEIMELTGGSQLEHFGFVLGARGKCLDLNNTLFTFLGIKRYKSFAQQVSRLTISLTLELLQIFGDR
ncbi:hypothetical protein scyTo_0009387 [Scyliorhinus torazame]|uniref:Reverse transcriptase domain-containing protein n=1 Tax=Scyliorhinus torazame TaxID=75743 RepID=A0A401NLE5_SCYTO|nr:hypothetical protein [Scyliorhinus torazame]